MWVCHDVNAPSWVCHDANALWWVCHDVNAFYLTQMQFKQKFLLFSKSRLPRSLEPKCFQNSIYFFRRLFFFLSARLECLVHYSCPKNMFYFDLRLPQKLVITVRNLWMGCQLEIKRSGSKRFIFTVWLRNECHVFTAFF